jgi:hypothetical protein
VVPYQGKETKHFGGNTGPPVEHDVGHKESRLAWDCYSESIRNPGGCRKSRLESSFYEYFKSI